MMWCKQVKSYDFFRKLVFGYVVYWCSFYVYNFYMDSFFTRAILQRRDGRLIDSQ